MEKRNGKLIDPFPNIKTDKEALRTSTSTTLRKRPPTNEFTASKNVNMVWDFTEQQKVWPDGKPKSLIEATQTTSNTPYKTMNKSGHPFALGVQVGGSPDDPGHAYLKPKKQGMFK
jgi:hypothetical protein